MVEAVEVMEMMKVEAEVEEAHHRQPELEETKKNEAMEQS